MKIQSRWLCLCVLIAACGPCGFQAPAGMKVIVPAMPTALDWNTSDVESWTNFPVLLATMRGLTTLGERHEVLPGLAERWEIRLTPEQREVITFHLRADVKWSDGKTPLTANDFVVGWRRALLGREPEDFSDILGAEAVHAALKANLDRAAIDAALARLGVRALDEHTLEVTLEHPRNYFLARLANVYPFFPAPSFDLAGKSDDAIRDYFERPHDGLPRTLGAYSVEAWDRAGERVRLVKNSASAFSTPDTPQSWTPEHVTLMQSEIGPALYERGRVDFVMVDSPLALRGSPPADLHRQELLSTYFVGISTEHAPLDNPDVRRAISYALDRDAIMSGLLPAARTTNRYLPPTLPGASTPEQARALPHLDPAKARALLSGVKLDRPLRLLFSAKQGFIPETAIAERVQAQLERVGFHVVIEPRSDFSAELARLGPDGKSTFDLYLKRVGADYAHPKTFFVLYERDGKHRTGWEKIDGGRALDRFEAELAAGDRETDLANAQPHYARAEAMLLDEYAILAPLYHPDRYYRAHEGISGVTIDPFNFLFLRNVKWAGARGER